MSLVTDQLYVISLFHFFFVWLRFVKGLSDFYRIREREGGARNFEGKTQEGRNPPSEI